MVFHSVFVFSERKGVVIKMKKLFFLVTVIVIAVMLLFLGVSCKGTTAETTAAETAIEETTATSAAETTAEETTSAEPVNLVIWYWGEQELPGVQKWMEESGKLYSENNPNVTVEAVLQTTDALYPAFRAAAAAKEGPDIQYLWADQWVLEDVWLGNIEPIYNWWSEEEIKNQLFYDEEYANGHYWVTKFYYGALVLLYNKQIFKDAGISVEAGKDITVDDFFNTCDALKAKGVTPIGIGNKDGWCSEFMNGLWGGLKLNNARDYVSAAIGEKSFQEPEYSNFFNMLEKMYKDGYFNEDVASLEQFPGYDIFKQGKAGMTVVFSSTIGDIQSSLGAENVGIIPCIKDTGLASGKYPGGAQSLAISSFSKNKKVAADFLRFLHTAERTKAFFEATNGSGLFADKSFDANLITNPTIKDLVANYVITGKVVPSCVSYLPIYVHDEGLLKSLILMLSGQNSANDVTQTMDDVAAAWRDQNPDAVKNFEGLKP